MKKLLTRRQIICLYILACLASKIQRLPALATEAAGRSIWISSGFIWLVEMLLLILVLKVSDKIGNKTIFEAIEEKLGHAVALFFSVVFIFYFTAKMLIPYKGCQDFFGTILFENLDWGWFSIAFLVVVFFFASKSIKITARVSEIFFPIIILSFLAIFALALPEAFFERLLPIEVPSFYKLTNWTRKYSLWVGDFLLAFLFMGRVDKKHFKKTIFISYIIFGLVYVFFLSTYFCVFENLAQLQKGAIATITEFFLLGFDVGRVDWLLAVFVMTGNIIVCGLYGYFICERIKYIVKAPIQSVAAGFCVALFFIDTYVFRRHRHFIIFLLNGGGWFGICINVLVPVFLYFTFRFSKTPKDTISIFAKERKKNAPTLLKRGKAKEKPQKQNINIKNNKQKKKVVG